MADAHLLSSSASLALIAITPSAIRTPRIIGTATSLSVNASGSISTATLRKVCGQLTLVFVRI